MKKLILGSVVAAALVFTGCGDDDETTPVVDTTAPVITTAATNTVDVNGTVALTATDANAVTFTEKVDSPMFSISGSTLIPEFATGTHSVVVTATDASANHNHSDKNITVTVTPNNTGGGNATRTVANPYIDADVVTVSGKKWLKIKGGDNDSVVETDADGVTTGSYTFKKNWADAKAVCTNLTLDGGGWHMPTREEAKALIENFQEGTADANGAILYTGELNSAVIGEESGIATSLLWTNDTDGEAGNGTGIYIGGKVYNYESADTNEYFVTCTK